LESHLANGETIQVNESSNIESGAQAGQLFFNQPVSELPKRVGLNSRIAWR